MNKNMTDAEMAGELLVAAAAVGIYYDDVENFHCKGDVFESDVLIHHLQNRSPWSDLPAEIVKLYRDEAQALLEQAK
jgi:hypothetical protein